LNFNKDWAKGDFCKGVASYWLYTKARRSFQLNLGAYKSGVYKKDKLVKSQKTSFFVIPDFGELSRVAKAGIQYFQKLMTDLDPGFRRGDDFLRDHQESRCEWQ